MAPGAWGLCAFWEGSVITRQPLWIRDWALRQKGTYLSLSGEPGLSLAEQCSPVAREPGILWEGQPRLHSSLLPSSVENLIVFNKRIFIQRNSKHATGKCSSHSDQERNLLSSALCTQRGWALLQTSVRCPTGTVPEDGIRAGRHHRLYRQPLASH